MDLSNYSKEDLLALQKDVAAALKSFDARKKKEAMAAAEAAAREHGFSLADLTSGKRAKAAAKYANPEDASQTWSGRGRKPAWVNAWEAAGKDLSECEI